MALPRLPWHNVLSGGAGEGYSLEYLRVPVTDEKAPKERDFVVLQRRIWDKPPDTALIFNCQMGRGRTSTGMIIGSLLLLRQQTATLPATSQGEALLYPALNIIHCLIHGALTRPPSKLQDGMGTAIYSRDHRIIAPPVAADRNPACHLAMGSRVDSIFSRFMAGYCPGCNSSLLATQMEYLMDRSSYQRPLPSQNGLSAWQHAKDQAG